MKRLFISTGSISLINVLTIIEQIGNKETYEDFLVVASFSQSKEFVENTKIIAGLHNFKDIKFIKKLKDINKKINLNRYDILFCPVFEDVKIHNHKNAYIFDEGPGFARVDIREFNKIKGAYITNYLGKFTYVDMPKTIKKIELDINIFKNIGKKILMIFNENEQLPTNKNALFIGHYIYSSLGDETAINFYNKYIDLLINKGYHVYFKGHPRDNNTILPIIKKNYENNKYFHILENNLPIEIYNYNFDLVAGAYSGTLVSLPHIRNIPAINLPFKELYTSSVGYKFKQYFAMYDEYIPSLADMEAYLGTDKLWDRYMEIISDKPEINSNERIKKIIFWKPNIIKDILYGIIGTFAKSKEEKERIKNLGRKDFIKLLGIKN